MGNRECNNKRGSIEQLYIALGRALNFNNFHLFSEMVIPWWLARGIYNGPISYLSRHIFEGWTDFMTQLRGGSTLL